MQNFWQNKISNINLKNIILYSNASQNSHIISQCRGQRYRPHSFHRLHSLRLSKGPYNLYESLKLTLDPLYTNRAIFLRVNKPVIVLINETVLNESQIELRNYTIHQLKFPTAPVEELDS